MPKVSVIIPVYNVEQYLKRCLDSVFNQTLKDIEIICVNDGSTDNSLKILEEYAKNDKRIKIYNQLNKGVGAARNLALAKTGGEYICFIGSDDEYSLNTVEKVYKIAKSNDAEVVQFNYKSFYENKEKIKEYNLAKKLLKFYN